ncbi:MAG: PDZ domain-containing protein [Paludibacter sp.]|nr:PDZ domain-containing protein [Paludibacter sp.]
MKKKIDLIAFFCILFLHGYSTIIVVSPKGNNTNIGNFQQPLRTIDAAIIKAKNNRDSKIEIILRQGTYYLDKVLELNSTSFAGKTVCISNFKGEEVVISGAKKINVKWVKSSIRNIWEANLDLPELDVLFVNGEKQVQARYPNYNKNARVFNGTSEDAIASDRIERWKNPTGGYIHALHFREWGDISYRILGKKNNELVLEGGWQNNRPSQMHLKYRFVENIFEELDAPNEWYYNKDKKILYYYPANEEILSNATIEIATLAHLVELRGTLEKPLKNVSIIGVKFVQTKRTFMETKEPLMRSDWTIYRGAAVFFENTENCSITDCEFTNLGGNAVFLSGYNYDDKITGSYFYKIGASAICLVGDTSAVRSCVNKYEKFTPLENMDFTPGPKNSKYPRQCIIEDNLIHNIGEVEKQTAGIELQIAAQITIRHNTIYKVPRAAINIGDGAFGGHLIEYNDAFDTVLETGDHGAFNSWGRDRYWHPQRNVMDSLVTKYPQLIMADAIYTTVIRNNRFSCNHGWDIDLDDGSSNYHIYNNLCLNGGLKLREGFYRVVENNICINNSIHPHVWFKNSHDIIQRNVLTAPYFPIRMNYWGERIDHNFFVSEKYLEKARLNGTDFNSMYGTITFTNPKTGNYSINLDCNAFKIGFENFPMDKFGVQKPLLKTLAKNPVFNEIITVVSVDKDKPIAWLGGKLRSINGLGDRSVYGLPDEKGVLILEVTKGGLLDLSGIKTGDVILKSSGKIVDDIASLMDAESISRYKGVLEVEIIRNQQFINKTILLK